MTDLELWLIGTPDQVTAAMAALATVGRVAGASKPDPMFGADAGRVRRYVRLSVATPRAQPATDRRGGQAVIGLPARRTA
ncbi:MAG TPA: hypothetical protein VK453_13950 [Micromonosporaceae bacterium]|nr:hypothetical protein [Micromonosporaceae bacterium]